MNLFFDTEFTGLKKDTELISIGIVAENGYRFYAENWGLNYESRFIDEWIRNNVIKNTILGGCDKLENELDNDPNTIVVLKDIQGIKYSLTRWLNRFENVQFVSDVCHFDFVLLIDIFGSAFNLPKNTSEVCYDINQDIARYYNITQREAFNMSREDIISKVSKKKIEGAKHNALYDAEVIKAIYDSIARK